MLTRNWYNRFVEYHNAIEAAAAPLSDLYEIAQDQAVRIGGIANLPEPFFSTYKFEDEKWHRTNMTWVVKLPEELWGPPGPWGARCPWQHFKMLWVPDKAAFWYTDYRSSGPGYKPSNSKSCDKEHFWTSLQDVFTYVTREDVCPVVYDFQYLWEDPFYLERLAELSPKPPPSPGYPLCLRQ